MGTIRGGPHPEMKSTRNTSIVQQTRTDWWRKKELSLAEERQKGQQLAKTVMKFKTMAPPYSLQAYFRKITHTQFPQAPSWRRAYSYSKKKCDFHSDTQLSHWCQKAILVSLLLPHSSSTGNYLLILSKHLTASITQLTWHFPVFMHRHPMLVLYTLHIAVFLISHANDHSNTCWFAFSRESIKLAWQS